MKKVILTTDGACIGNPGPGGWACILRFENYRGEMYGAVPQTTNNRMELTAVIHGLNALKEPCLVELSTDSQYVQKGITEWLPKWKTGGWVTTKRLNGTRVPVSNKELWQDLEKATEPHQIQWRWVKGHHRHRDNIRCDELANRAAREKITSDGIRVVPERSHRR